MWCPFHLHLGEYETRAMLGKICSVFLFTFMTIQYVFVDVTQRQLTKQLSVKARKQTFSKLYPWHWQKRWRVTSKSSSQILGLSFHSLSLSLGQQAASAKHCSAQGDTGAGESLSNCQMLCIYFFGLVGRLCFYILQFWRVCRSCRCKCLISLPMQQRSANRKQNMSHQTKMGTLEILLCWINYLQYNT